MLLGYIGILIFLEATIFNYIIRQFKSFTRDLNEKFDNFQERCTAMNNLSRNFLITFSNRKNKSLTSTKQYIGFIILNMTLQITYLCILLFLFEYNVAQKTTTAEKFYTYFNREYKQNWPNIGYCELSYCGRSGSVIAKDVLCHMKHNLSVRITFPILVICTILILCTEFVYILHIFYLLYDSTCKKKYCNLCNLNSEHSYSKFKLLNYVQYPMKQLFEQRPWLKENFSKGDIISLIIMSREAKSSLAFQSFFNEYIQIKLSGDTIDSFN